MKYKLTGTNKNTGENLLSSFNQIIDSKWTQVFDELFTVPNQDFEQVNPQDFLRSDEIVADMMCYMENKRWIDWDYKETDINKQKIRWKNATKQAIFKQFQLYCDEYRKRIPMPLFKWKQNKTVELVIPPPPPAPVVNVPVVNDNDDDDDVVVENNPMDDSLLQMMNDADYDVMNTSLIMDNPLPGANAMDFPFLTNQAEVGETREQELQRKIDSLEEDKTMMYDSIQALQSRLAEANELKTTLENKLREVNEINTTLEDRLRVNRQMMDDRDKEMKQALRGKDAEVAVLVGERDKLIGEYEEKLMAMSRMYEERLANMARDMKRELKERMLELFDDNVNENNKRGRLNSMDEEEPKRRRMSVDIYEQDTVTGEEEPDVEVEVEVDVEREVEAETVTLVEREVEREVEVEVETIVEVLVAPVVGGDMETIWNNRNTILLEELKKDVGFAFFKRRINSLFDEKKHKRSFFRKVFDFLSTQWFTNAKPSTKTFLDFCEKLGEKYQHWFTE